ncbi:AlwI family type II restriction endonuclease [Bacillus sp. FDAARGOS_235]|uniref:AlwI family type II restriction endonuclease n=1 Tax=Bacillus sp. FDAARGOS_235 TaxID=1839798 RepID=UPI00119FBAD7|nr:AlwI family type II restriction endonuclease [Bacillus sp. FDAARGOS_235]
MSERKVWFITRPERDPKFHALALSALKEATSNFQNRWKGNRDLHKRYEEVLGNKGLKKPNISNDGSGGRTWVAMLKTFAYVYVNENGYLIPTKVGEALLARKNVFENTSKQILTLQIPNAYFLESGFRPKYASHFKIRPARFLIKLTNQISLDYYVTKEEITYFVLTASHDNQLHTVTQNILQFRKANEQEKRQIKIDIAEQYEHRTRSDSAARDFETAHSDVAHTFMLLCDYTQLVEYIRGECLRVNPSYCIETTQRIVELDLRYPFNNRYQFSLERMAENNGLDINSYKATRFHGEKPATNKGKNELLIQEALSKYPIISKYNKIEVVESLKAVGIRNNEALLIVEEKLKEEEISFFSNGDFYEAYLAETNNLAFEDKTGVILKELGFEVIMRPKSTTGDLTEIEIGLLYGRDGFGLIDAKNYRSSKFSLPSNLASHMASEYIPNYEGYEGRKVSFFGYIAADKIGGEKNLEKITEKTKNHIDGREVKGFIMNAKTLLAFLDYCIENNLSQEERVSLFLRAITNKGYATFSALHQTITTE